MSDQESEFNQPPADAAWEAPGPFSSNGSEPGDVAIATAPPAGFEADDRAKFLTDLARVMQSTAAAEQARNAEGTEQRRQTHIDMIRAREALEAEELRELAKEDVKGIDAWSEGEIKRIKLERERRIASRREQLQIRLEEHRAVVAREVAAVEAAVATYRAEIEQFFGGLEAETDPVAIARQAGNQPPFPDLDRIGPDDAPVGTDYGYVVSASVSTEAAPEAVSEAPEAMSETSDAVSETTAEAASDEEPHDDQGAGSAGEMIGVMDPDAGSRTAETPWDSGVVAAGDGDGSDVPDGTEPPEGIEEPAPVAAEARVVMPRSSGAGSWLRWPSSADRSDQPR